MLTISPGWHAECLRVVLYGQLLSCTGSAMTIILDHSLLHLIIGLSGTKLNICLIVVLLIILYPVSGALIKV